MVDEVPVELLRSALDHALNVAAAGGVEVPVAIRPLVKASKLDAKALRRLLQAIEEAPNFRAEVAARASADNVDEAGLLWLTRPDGWRTRLAELVPQPLDRRFRAVEDKLRRRDARVAALEAELQRLRRQAASSALSAKGSRDELIQLRADLTAAQAVARRKEDEARQAGEQLAGARRAQHEALERLATAERARSNDLPATLADATALVDQLAAVVRRAAEMAAPAPRRAARQARPQRVAQRLPGGVRADSEEAVEHLLRVPGLTVLVDGYNVAMLGWPSASLERRRQECVAVCEDVARRFRVPVTVVFDGAVVPGANAPRRRSVTVEYSPPGVTADDVLRQRVLALPVDTPVVVVTNDREILDAVRAAGANTAPSEIYLRVARR